ncbi:MAG: Dyp-type peroxidase [Lewinellaceae bacterium]|nr:Dyp-type peroxidase [Lewinellaceae bacterium]MCB9286605.1 Dyp-type peroxidase [Lewinellaceae bacterium]
METNNRRLWTVDDLDEILDQRADDRIFEELGLAKIKETITQDVQSNILKGVKHKYLLYCFFTFRKSRKLEIVDWLKNLPLTSTDKQIKDEAADSINLFLSFQGYEFFCDPRKIGYTLKLDDDILAFQEGLEQRCSTSFGKINEEELDPNYSKPSHALILLASNDDVLKECNEETEDDIRQEKLLDYFEEKTKVITRDPRKTHRYKKAFGKVFFEIGFRNPEGSDGPSREWFGFNDGISNPRFFSRYLPDGQGEPDKPSKLNTVLRRNSLAGDFACGSFVVFLKLEQDDEAFRKMVKELAKHLKMEDHRGQVEAYIMGRYRDGTPLHSDFNFPNIREQKRNLNAFDFSNDKEGYNCPLHAHIRKANPRDGQEDNLRIVRRGRVYGREGSGEKGILFLSYQNSLHQFEDIVNRGLYGYNYKKRRIGKDVLFVDKGDEREYHRYWNATGNTRTPYLRPEKLVKFRGGQYFFASSISFIQKSLERFI